MTLINVLENEFNEIPPVVLDRVRFIVYVIDEVQFKLQVDEKCVQVEDKFDLEI